MDIENIFENAKFGDHYKCRDGADAVFVCITHSESFDRDFAGLVDSITCKVRYYFLNGKKDLDRDCGADILPNN